MWQTKSIPGARLQDDKNKNPLMNMDLKNDKKCINNYRHACLPQENLEESMMLFKKKNSSIFINGISTLFWWAGFGFCIIHLTSEFLPVLRAPRMQVVE